MIYVVAVSVIFVTLILALVFRYSFLDIDKSKADKKSLEGLSARIDKMLEQQEELGRRLSNVEHIISDERFDRPLEPREGIQLKRELDELKILLERINKR